MCPVSHTKPARKMAEAHGRRYIPVGWMDLKEVVLAFGYV